MPGSYSNGNVYTVTEINSNIRRLLETNYSFIRIAGEISNLKRPFSGHYYFSLKDAKSQINAVLFKNQHRYLQQDLKDGQQVICDGRISVYEPRGSYQIIVDTIDFTGAGTLQLAFEKLKKDLQNRGFFDSDRKKPLPAYVNKIVLITSPTGAAVHDFLTICRQRKASLLVQILPVRVQGAESAAEICQAIKSAAQLSPDVIVLCRGGGSIEDLWSFNEESVAQAIYESSIPIVTGIGHETDFTIADFCADKRCATPTAAAELLAMDSAAVRLVLQNCLRRITRTAAWQMESLEARLSRVRRTLQTFDIAFSSQTMRLDNSCTRLIRIHSHALENSLHAVRELKMRLNNVSPRHKIDYYSRRLEVLDEKLVASTNRTLRSKQVNLQRFAALLDSLSPLATLARGYSIVTKKATAGATEKVITRSSDVAEHDPLEVRLAEGSLACRVTRVKKD